MRFGRRKYRFTALSQTVALPRGYIGPDHAGSGAGQADVLAPSARSLAQKCAWLPRWRCPANYWRSGAAYATPQNESNQCLHYRGRPGLCQRQRMPPAMWTRPPFHASLGVQVSFQAGPSGRLWETAQFAFVFGDLSPGRKNRQARNVGRAYRFILVRARVV